MLPLTKKLTEGTLPNLGGEDSPPSLGGGPPKTLSKKHFDFKGCFGHSAPKIWREGLHTSSSEVPWPDKPPFPDVSFGWDSVEQKKKGY